MTMPSFSKRRKRTRGSNASRLWIVSWEDMETASNIEYRPDMPVAPEGQQTPGRAAGDFRGPVEEQRHPARVLVHVRRAPHQQRDRLGERHRPDFLRCPFR